MATITQSLDPQLTNQQIGIWQKYEMLFPQLRTIDLAGWQEFLSLHPALDHNAWQYKLLSEEMQPTLQENTSQPDKKPQPTPAHSLLFRGHASSGHYYHEPPVRPEMMQMDYRYQAVVEKEVKEWQKANPEKVLPKKVYVKNAEGLVMVNPEIMRQIPTLHYNSRIVFQQQYVVPYKIEQDDRYQKLAQTTINAWHMENPSTQLPKELFVPDLDGTSHLNPEIKIAIPNLQATVEENFKKEYVNAYNYYKPEENKIYDDASADPYVIAMQKRVAAQTSINYESLFDREKALPIPQQKSHEALLAESRVKAMTTQHATFARENQRKAAAYAFAFAKQKEQTSIQQKKTVTIQSTTTYHPPQQQLPRRQQESSPQQQHRSALDYVNDFWNKYQQAKDLKKIVQGAEKEVAESTIGEGAATFAPEALEGAEMIGEIAPEIFATEGMLGAEGAAGFATETATGALAGEGAIAGEGIVAGEAALGAGATLGTEGAVAGGAGAAMAGSGVATAAATAGEVAAGAAIEATVGWEPELIAIIIVIIVAIIFLVIFLVFSGGGKHKNTNSTQDVPGVGQEEIDAHGATSPVPINSPITLSPIVPYSGSEADKVSVDFGIPMDSYAVTDPAGATITKQGNLKVLTWPLGSVQNGNPTITITALIDNDPLPDAKNLCARYTKQSVCSFSGP